MIVFFSNGINQHQIAVADCLYELTEHDYVYVELSPFTGNRVKAGLNSFCRPYLLKAYANKEAYLRAVQLAKTADVALFGAESLSFEVIRMREGKLSLEVSERWLKRGWLNLFSPRLLRNMWYYHTLFYNKPIYKLCASAYCAKDQYLLHSYQDRCYKWGYFTKVDDFDVEANVKGKSDTPVSLMWCARFLVWKHPELIVKLARKLKDNGFVLSIDMFGSGIELEKTKKLCKRMDVEDMISFKDNKPNDEILHEMRKHDIFLFTSDKNEGWGAVLNEAMSNGCTVVASNQIGSVPFLIKDGVNGLIFESDNVESLYIKVVSLIENPEERRKMAINAYYTIKNVWSPKVAAYNLLKLIEELKRGHDTIIQEGPCSKALVL